MLRCSPVVFPVGGTLLKPNRKKNEKKNKKNFRAPPDLITHSLSVTSGAILVCLLANDNRNANQRVRWPRPPLFLRRSGVWKQWHIAGTAFCLWRAAHQVCYARIAGDIYRLKYWRAWRLGPKKKDTPATTAFLSNASCFFGEDIDYHCCVWALEVLTDSLSSWSWKFMIVQIIGGFLYPH